MVKSWYHNGLHFRCTGCGECCTGSPGYVWITQQEAQDMADFLHLPLEVFLEQYTRKIEGRMSLNEHPVSYDCVFLKEKKCTVYPVRPQQCKTFPWWSDNLAAPYTWRETAQRCEGIDHPEAPLIPYEDIETAKNS